MDGVVYGNFSVTFGDGHGLRLERAPLGGSRPEPARRGRAASGPPPYAVGRGEELALIARTVRGRGAVEFVGPCGSGRTTLLLNAGADVYLRVGGTAMDDLLQDLMREFYVYPAGGVRLSAEQCRAALWQVGAVVALDDVAYAPGELASLRRALAGCGLVIGAGRPVLGALGQSRTLPGLPESAAIALLAREAGRYLADDEMPAIRRLVAAVGGEPLHLRQAAALVRLDGHTFASLAARAEADPGVLDELSISALGPQARRALAVLALLGGALLPGEVVARLTDATFVLSELEKLRDRGLAEQREDRFGLPVCKAEPYRHILYRHLGIGVALRTLADWLVSSGPDGPGVRDIADAVVSLLGLGAEAREWQGVLRLTTAAERILFVQGHWQAWQHTLSHGAEAARQAGDTAAEAYFSHQQGTLHFLEDRADAARQLLQRALELRSAYGDEAGAAVTRANLAFVTPGPGGGPGYGPPSGPGSRSRSRRWWAVAAGVLLVLLGVGVAVGTAGSGHSSGSAGSGQAGGPPTSSGGDGGTSPVHSADDAGSASSSSSGDGGAGRNGGTSVNAGQDNGGTSGGTLEPPVIDGASDYGDVHIYPGSDAPVTDFTITNPNDRPIPLDGVALADDSSDFSVADDSCRDAAATGQLAAGASCTVSVEFTPTGLGARSDTLTVDAAGRTVTSPLTGRGYAVVVLEFTGDSRASVDITTDGSTTNCPSPGECTAKIFDAQSPVSLQAHAVDGATTFAGWTGDCSGSGAVCTPQLGDVHTTAQFATYTSPPPHIA